MSGQKIQYFNKTDFNPVQAVNNTYNFIQQITIKPNGRFIDNADMVNKRFVIVLGVKTAEKLFGDAEPVGQYVRVGSKPFLVIGVMKDKSQFTSVSGPGDSYYNWIPSTTYELITNKRFIDSIAITYKDVKLLPATKQAIQTLIAINHAADPNDANITDLSDIAHQQNTISKFLIGLEIFLGMIGLLTLVVAAVGIANVMYASVVRDS